MPTWNLLITASIVLSLFASVASAQPRANVSRLRNLVIEVENQVTRMEYNLQTIKQKGSQTSDFTIGKFNEAVAAFDKAWAAAGEEVAKLPGDDEQVKKLIDRLNESLPKYKKAIDEATATLNNAKAAVEDVGGWDQIRADIERLDAIAYRYSDFPQLPSYDPEQTLELVKMYPQVVTEIKTFEEKYATFLQTDNADTAAIKRELADAKKKVGQVLPTVREEYPTILKRAADRLDEAEKLMAEGEEERNPAYFSPDGGVAQQMDQAKLELQVATAIEPSQAQAHVDRYKQLTLRSAAARETFKKEIIAANKGYGDKYRGGDRQALEDGARKAFSSDNPDDKILEVRIPSSDWKRTTKWEWWKDAFYFYDKSFLQAIVFFEAQNEAGEREIQMLPVKMSKDHTEGDSLFFSAWVKQPLDKMDLDLRMLPENFEK